MNKILSILIMMSWVLMMDAQNISVSDFHLDEMDLTANQQGTIVLDQNGEKCALIKVITTETGFTFDVGSLGVQKVEQKTGEIWLYVPRGIRKVILNHQILGRLEYQLPIGINGARTYQMTLKADKPVVSDEKQPLTIKFSPSNATLFVDGDMVDTEGGQVTLNLLVGNHSYNIGASGYVGQSGAVTIRSGAPAKLNLELDRKMSKATALKPKEVVEEKPIENIEGDKVAEVQDVGLQFTVGNVQFLMVEVKAGTFTIGAHKNQSAPVVQERPSHEVTITKDFYIGETEVTQELWQEIMGDNPSYDRGSTLLPVEQVTWLQCQDFCKELSRRTGYTFRLPTNAEWEYAARGGQKSMDFVYSGSNIVTEVGWINSNGGQAIHEVKQLKPNELSLYDMSGNVWEWCQDNFGSYRSGKQVDPFIVTTEENKVIRSGSVAERAISARTSYRYYQSQYSQSETIGLRVLMEKK